MLEGTPRQLKLEEKAQSQLQLPLTEIQREHIEAKRYTLNSPELRPYARRARHFVISRWAGILFCTRHQRPLLTCRCKGCAVKECRLNGDDAKLARRLKIGVAIAFLCGWDGHNEPALQLIEEFAWRKRKQDGFVQSICREISQDLSRRQRTLFDLIDVAETLPDREQEIVRRIGCEREDKDDVAESLGVHRTTVERTVNRVVDHLSR